MMGLIRFVLVVGILAFGGYWVWENKIKEEPTEGGQIKERLDDALNRRENEELKDAMEDAEKAAKDLAREVKAAAEKAIEEVTQ